MSNYIYRKTDEDWWTVGFYAPNGDWVPEGYLGSGDEAASRVHFLNGGTGFDPPDITHALEAIEEQISLVVESLDKIASRLGHHDKDEKG